MIKLTKEEYVGLFTILMVIAWIFSALGVMVYLGMGISCLYVVVTCLLVAIRAWNRIKKG